VAQSSVLVWVVVEEEVLLVVQVTEILVRIPSTHWSDNWINKK
jgi:hypothetical protein